MLNNTVVSFYDNFGLMFKGSKYKATNGIEKWSLYAASLLIGASSRENPNEYPHRFYTPRNYSLWRTFLLLAVWDYLHSFSHSCLRKRGRKIYRSQRRKQILAWNGISKSTWKSIRYFIGRQIILASTLKVPKISPPKLQQKSACTYHHTDTVVWCPSPRNPHVYPHEPHTIWK